MLTETAVRASDKRVRFLGFAAYEAAGGFVLRDLFQQDDGGWWPNWHWGQFEDVWPVAEKEWAGKITAETLWTLRRFGRLAGLRG